MYPRGEKLLAKHPFLQGKRALFETPFKLDKVSFGENSGDHNHQYSQKNTAIQMGGVLQYKWEAYCNTHGRSTANIPFPQSVWGTRSTATHIGGVLQCKSEVYCDTFLRSWKKGNDPHPHPQDKIQHLDFTKDPRPLYYKTPPCAFYHNNVCSKAVFGP